MHEDNPIDSYEYEVPLIKLLFDTFNKDVKNDLEINYLSKFKECKKWTCVSDYCFDQQKANNVVTFSFFPNVFDPDQLIKTISKLAPSEVKQTRNINPDFIRFLKEFPFVSFSFILENHNTLYFENEDEFKKAILEFLRKLIYEYIPKWDIKRPHLKEYHKEIENKAIQIIRFFNEGKRIKIMKNLYLISSIGSFLATQIANFTLAEEMAWFSDRDEINDLAEHFSTTFFQIQFHEHLIKWDAQVIYTDASSRADEWHRDLVKIPDYISGALADINLKTWETTHPKFTPILRDFISDNSTNMFLFRLRFEPNSGCFLSRIIFEKNTQTPPNVQ